jgi:hypothetical protein
MPAPVLQEIEYLHGEIERLANSVARGEAERRDMGLHQSILEHYRLTLLDLLKASEPAASTGRTAHSATSRPATAQSLQEPPR